jgi:hypothetical protein
MPSTSFHHRRLSSSNSIRLLTLLPSSNFGAVLEITLTEIDIGISSQNLISYEALSYVWGSPVGTIPVSCEGEQLLVTPNCESALRHLRLADIGRVLWVDSICIDQGGDTESVRERNMQVALMDQIYQKAACTLCWLGPGNDFTAELMSHLERIGTCSSNRVLKKFLLFDGEYSRLRYINLINPMCS